MDRKIEIEKRNHLTKCLGLPAHPVWGRIIWDELERLGVLDEQALSRCGITRKTLWPNGDTVRPEWTYGKWFALLRQANVQGGPDFHVRIARTALHHSPPFMEAITATAPDLRTFLQFCEQQSAAMEPLVGLRLKPARGGVLFCINYPMSGCVKEAFMISAIATINHCVQVITGKTLRNITIGIRDQSGLWTQIEERLGVVIKEWGTDGDDIVMFIEDDVLDRQSIGFDPFRYERAVDEFKAICDNFRTRWRKANLCDLVVSIQFTSSRIYSMEQMADKVGLKMENYRKALQKLGTSHKELIKDCIKWQTAGFEKEGMTQADICKQFNITPARLRRLTGRDVIPADMARP